MAKSRRVLTHSCHCESQGCKAWCGFAVYIVKLTALWVVCRAWCSWQGGGAERSSTVHRRGRPDPTAKRSPPPKQAAPLPSETQSQPRTTPENFSTQSFWEDKKRQEHECSHTSRSAQRDPAQSWYGAEVWA